MKGAVTDRISDRHQAEKSGLCTKMKRKRRLIWLVLTIALLLTSIIPARIAIAFHQTPIPQAMFIVGDAVERMTFAKQGVEGDYFGGEKGAGRIK